LSGRHPFNLSYYNQMTNGNCISIRDTQADLPYISKILFYETFWISND